MQPWEERVVERVAQELNTGHAKRDACVLRHVRRLLAGPSGEAWSEAKSWYELLDNPQVSVDELRAVRRRVVRAESPSGPEGQVLVVHDVSELNYTGHAAKRDRRPLGNGQSRGYEYHACLVLEPVSGRFLGLAHDTVIARDGPDDRAFVDYEGDPLCAGLSAEACATLPDNHRHQLSVHIRALAGLWTGPRVVHAADREFDDLPAMASARAAGHDFVLRALGTRTVEAPVPEGWRAMPLCRALEALPMQPYKELPLDARGHVSAPETAVRTARLCVGAGPIRLCGPFKRAGRPGQRLPAPLALNVVLIQECAPPPGHTPLRWVLYTSLPVDTLEQQAWVGRLYELRWSIEEYFKLLKSGFGVERDRFDNAQKTAKALVFYSLAAVALLDLKAVLGLAPTGPLEDEAYARVKHAMRHPEEPALDPAWALLAAVLHAGGWLGRRRDPVGPKVLMRGLLRLATAARLLQRFPALLNSLAPPQAAGTFQICV